MPRTRTVTFTLMTEMDSQTERLPVVYLPHGGGPWPFVDDSRADS